jgi:peptidoglycan/LPS O-acetylase OafA/YrhL
MDRIKGLDGLRTLAIALVFLQHYTVFGARLELGGYGVWLFFVLSGFLIVRILHEERRRVEAGATTVKRALGRFYWRRTLRIFPIYYLTLAVCVLLGLVGVIHDRLLPDMLWHASYLSNVYFGEMAAKWVGRFGPFWSLAIEEQFYLLAAPALLFAPARWSRNLCALLICASLLMSLVMRSSGANEMQLYTNSLINFFALAFGGWLALGLKARRAEGRRSWAGVLAIGLYLGLIVGFDNVGLYRPDTARLIAGLPIVLASLFGGLAILSIYNNQQSWLVKGLELWPLRAFGRISYGFYLYHNLIDHYLITRVSAAIGHPVRPSDWIEISFSFLVGLTMAVLSWLLIEKPLLRLKDRPPAWAPWLNRAAASGAIA